MTENHDTTETPARRSGAKRWCFTWWNYPEDYEAQFERLQPLFEAYCIGEERGTNDRPHLQGWLSFKRKSRPFECLNLERTIHWEVMRSSEDVNTEYCSKEGRRVVSFNIPVPFVVNITLTPWEEKLVQIVDEEPDTRYIHWVWESRGGIGKTTFQKWLYLNRPGVLPLCGKACDMKHGVCEYQKLYKKTPRCILVKRTLDIGDPHSTFHVPWRP